MILNVIPNTNNKAGGGGHFNDQITELAVHITLHVERVNFGKPESRKPETRKPV